MDISLVIFFNYLSINTFFEKYNKYLQPLIIILYNYVTAYIFNNKTMLIKFLAIFMTFIPFLGDDITKWRKGDDGYEYHLASSIAEWFTAILTMSYIFTFKNEFKKIILHEPEIEVINNTTKVITPISSEVRY